MKAVIVLRNGTEITVQTENLRVVRTWTGKVREVFIDNARDFIRYLNAREIACILSYPDDKDAEGSGCPVGTTPKG